MNSYLGPLRRFWWLVLAAVPVAILAGLLVIYQVQLSPPGLTERHKPSYQATVQVLVTTRANPYLKAEDSPTSQALLDAANYLPFIVQSDRVSAIRTKRFGKINGEVTAEALYARVTTNRGLRPSSIPIMEVHGTAPTPKGASKLATTSVASLITWLAAEQQKAKVGRGVRVKLEALQAPRLTVQQQKSTGLALLVFSVVLLGFLALAWMLDRVFPADAAAETPAAGALGHRLGPRDPRRAARDPGCRRGGASRSDPRCDERARVADARRRDPQRRRWLGSERRARAVDRGSRGGLAAAAGGT